ncbi:MAG: PLDc N-terminal domain-containing protein [Pyrinomonadaceae bacterium]
MIDAQLAYPLCILVFMILNIIVPIVALVDIFRTNFRKENDKAIWVLIVILGGIVGAIIYFLVSGEPSKNNKGLK